MPIPLRIGRWNRAVTNRVTTPLARRLPGFGIVHHVGRRSGRRYQTPVNLFPSDGGFTIALTYGADADWVRNVLAAGGCEIETRGRRVPCQAPRIVHDPAARGIRLPERPVLRLLGVADFLSVAADDAPTPDPG